MLKVISFLMIFAVAITLCSCSWLGNDDKDIRTNVSQNALKIQHLEGTVSAKADKSDIKAVESYLKDHDGKITKCEDRITALENIKSVAKTNIINPSVKKIKKICKKTKKTTGEPIDVNDVIAGYGEMPDNSEIYQPFTVIPSSVPSKEVGTPVNLIDLSKKTEAVQKNSLESLRKNCESTEKLVDQHNSVLETHKDMIEKHDLQINQYQLAIDDHRKTLDSHNKELQQFKDFQLLTETRLRVLETDNKKNKEEIKLNYDSIEYLKKDVDSIKTELKAEEAKEEDKEAEETDKEESE